MINLKKVSNTTSRRVSTQVQQATIPSPYWVVRGVVFTNLKEAQEYKQAR